MTATAFLWLCLALVAAGTDWLAVYHENKRLEFVAKPLTMVLLIAAAVALDPAEAAVRYWFVVALLLSLAGDVFLMLREDLFIAGLGSFLLAHIAYVVGLLTSGVHAGGMVVGLVVVAAGFLAIGIRLLAGVRRSDPGLVPPVLAYIVVISLLVVAAFGTTRFLAIAGAVTFYVSDSLLGRQRFVHARERGDTAVMVTYHLAQFLLVLSLV